MDWEAREYLGLAEPQAVCQGQALVGHLPFELVGGRNQRVIKLFRLQ
jgi:hypothetical protein